MIEADLGGWAALITYTLIIFLLGYAFGSKWNGGK